jgi:shikimate kinase
MLGKQNIFLVGPMGSGKTAVGRQLAKSLHLPFIDSDAEIEQRTGVDIRFIFEKEGEPGFREREREVIELLTLRQPIVLATGGGAILHPDNRRCLAMRGFVVYLETSVAQQFERVRHGRSRPLLEHADPAQRLAELLEHRAPLYREVADFTVATDGCKVHSVAERIIDEFRVSGATFVPDGG